MLYIREILLREVPLLKVAESLAILVQTDVYECENEREELSETKLTPVLSRSRHSWKPVDYLHQIDS